MTNLAAGLLHARVLSVLKQAKETGYQATRPWIIRAAGFSEKSGTFSKAMNYGRIEALNCNGMLAAGWVEKKEEVYLITEAGVAMLEKYLSVNGPLPELKDKDECTNLRYK
jgi:hypothetical protein